MNSITKEQEKSLIADMSMVLVALLWGGGFIAVKDALNTISPLYIIALRFSFASAIMALIFFKKLKKIKKKDVIAGSIVGIFLFGGFVAQTIGMKYTTAGKNAFLTATNVVIVPFLAWTVNKKRPDMYSIVSAFLTFIGIGMLSLQKGFTIGLGDGLTLICAVFFAAQIVAVGYFAVNTDPIILTIVQLAFTAVLSLVSAAIFEAAPKGFGVGSIRAMAYLVLFSTLLASLIQNIAQKYTPPTHAAIIMCMESVFGSVFAVLMLHDVFSEKMIAGCLLIFFSVMLSETKLDFLHKKSTK
jgi:drug/metabolite transporter (DMT)-like permease